MEKNSPDEIQTPDLCPSMSLPYPPDQFFSLRPVFKFLGSCWVKLQLASILLTLMKADKALQQHIHVYEESLFQKIKFSNLFSSLTSWTSLKSKYDDFQLSFSPFSQILIHFVQCFSFVFLYQKEWLKNCSPCSYAFVSIMMLDKGFQNSVHSRRLGEILERPGEDSDWAHDRFLKRRRWPL